MENGKGNGKGKGRNDIFAKYWDPGYLPPAQSCASRSVNMRSILFGCIKTAHNNTQLSSINMCENVPKLDKNV